MHFLPSPRQFSLVSTADVLLEFLFLYFFINFLVLRPRGENKRSFYPYVKVRRPLAFWEENTIAPYEARLFFILFFRYIAACAIPNTSFLVGSRAVYDLEPKKGESAYFGALFASIYMCLLISLYMFHTNRANGLGKERGGGLERRHSLRPPSKRKITARYVCQHYNGGHHIMPERESRIVLSHPRHIVVRPFVMSGWLLARKRG